VIGIMTIDDWLVGACADADRRGLADLKPLLAALADATRALRADGWEEASCAPADRRASGAPKPAADGASR
jgi:hypothetical protein